MKVPIKTQRFSSFRKFGIAIFLLAAALTAKAQYLYPEHYPHNDSSFCMDCGEVKAHYPANYANLLADAFGKANMKKASGTLWMQVFVDTKGNARLLSANNFCGVTSSKLHLEKVVASIPWRPSDPAKNVCVCLKLFFSNGKIKVERVTLSFDPAKIAEPIEKREIDNTLSYTFRTFDKPAMSNRSDGIAAAPDGTIWIGSHYGLGRYRGPESYHTFTYKNSPLEIDPRYNRTYYLNNQAVDSKGRLWSIQGYNLFLIDGDKWKRFDTLNSPVDWPRELFVDKDDNLWETDWDGIHRYDGTQWHTYDSSNYPLPTSKMLSFYIDNQGRQWIGTWGGNVMIEGDSVTQFEQGETPLAQGYISNAVQDKRGTLWFTFTCGKWKHFNGVLLSLAPDGTWTTHYPKAHKETIQECCNDLLYDETRDQLWVSINSVGLLLHDIPSSRWELYTPENSSLPDGYIMQLTQATDGSIWGASFGGAFQIVPRQ